MIPDSVIEVLHTPSEARSWSREDTQRRGGAVNLPGWLAYPMAIKNCSLGNDVGCLLRGTGPLSSRRKDRASLAAATSIADSENDFSPGSK